MLTVSGNTYENKHFIEDSLVWTAMSPVLKFACSWGVTESWNTDKNDEIYSHNIEMSANNMNRDALYIVPHLQIRRFQNQFKINDILGDS